MSNDVEIEAMIVEKGKTAPRITPQHIDSCIASEHYFTAADGLCGTEALLAAEDFAAGELRPVREFMVPLSLRLLTFCVLVLRNGFTVTGESACASPENFDAEIGKKIARGNAVQKIWGLEGYALRTRLAEAQRGELA